MTNPILPYEPPKQPSIARQVFGVIVRAAGLLVALWGMYCLLYGVTEVGLGLTRRYSPQTNVVYGIVLVAFGALLIRGEWLVRFAYGRD